MTSALQLVVSFGSPSPLLARRLRPPPTPRLRKSRARCGRQQLKSVCFERLSHRYSQRQRAACRFNKTINPHTGCFQSSLFISALWMLLGVWISVSPSLPCSPDDRITSHPVELVGSDHNPSCSRASGSDWRDHPFSRRVSARGSIRGHRPPGSGEAVAFASLEWG